VLANWRMNWRTGTKVPPNRDICNGLENRCIRSDGGHKPGCESFITTDGINLDWRGLGVTGDDNLERRLFRSLT
jgi:hypothetical protein